MLPIAVSTHFHILEEAVRFSRANGYIQVTHQQEQDHVDTKRVQTFRIHVCSDHSRILQLEFSSLTSSSSSSDTKKVTSSPLSASQFNIFLDWPALLTEDRRAILHNLKLGWSAEALTQAIQGRYQLTATTGPELFRALLGAAVFQSSHDLWPAGPDALVLELEFENPFASLCQEERLPQATHFTFLAGEPSLPLQSDFFKHVSCTGLSHRFLANRSVIPRSMRIEQKTWTESWQRFLAICQDIPELKSKSLPWTAQRAGLCRQVVQILMKRDAIWSLVRQKLFDAFFQLWSDSSTHIEVSMAIQGMWSELDDKSRQRPYHWLKGFLERSTVHSAPQQSRWALALLQWVECMRYKRTSLLHHTMGTVVKNVSKDLTWLDQLPLYFFAAGPWLLQQELEPEPESAGMGHMIECPDLDTWPDTPVRFLSYLQNHVVKDPDSPLLHGLIYAACHAREDDKTKLPEPDLCRLILLRIWKLMHLNGLSTRAFHIWSVVGPTLQARDADLRSRWYVPTDWPLRLDEKDEEEEDEGMEPMEDVDDVDDAAEEEEEEVECLSLLQNRLMKLAPQERDVIVSLVESLAPRNISQDSSLLTTGASLSQSWFILPEDKDKEMVVRPWAELSEPRHRNRYALDILYFPGSLGAVAAHRALVWTALHTQPLHNAVFRTLLWVAWNNRVADLASWIQRPVPLAKTLTWTLSQPGYNENLWSNWKEMEPAHLQTLPEVEQLQWVSLFGSWIQGNSRVEERYRRWLSAVDRSDRKIVVEDGIALYMTPGLPKLRMSDMLLPLHKLPIKDLLLIIRDRQPRMSLYSRVACMVLSFLIPTHRQQISSALKAIVATEKASMGEKGMVLDSCIQEPLHSNDEAMQELLLAMKNVHMQ